MYQVSTENSVKNNLYICKDYHIQPSEINKMPYYQYEIILEEINAIVKEQEKERDRQEKEHAAMQKNMNPASMMNSMNRNMPNMNMPKVNVPKF